MTDTKLLSLNEIFNEKFFRIPDFQRGYSWEESQLNDFWDDLINLKENKTHYTGLLTVEPVLRKKIESLETWQDDLWLFERNFKSYYLIDGQQRLTTSIILINEILNTLEDDEDIFFKQKESWVNKFLYQTYKGGYKSYMFGYEKDNPSNEFFKTKILNQESSTSDKVPEYTLYTTNLENAQKFFISKLSSIDIKQKETLFKKLVSSFKFNFYEIDEELDVYITFETMNNRGKPLSNLELLKNRLIYLTTMLDDEEQSKRLSKDINEAWKTIYEYLGKKKNLNDDDFLRNHWIMYFKYDRSESESYAKYLLTKYFTTKNVINNKVGFKEIQEYIKSLQKSVKYWFYLYTPDSSSYSNETKEWLSKLNRLRMGAFPPLFISVMNKCNESDLLNVLKVAERFIFLLFMISQRRSNTANTKIYRFANEHYKGIEELSNIIESISYLIDGEYEDDAGELVYDGWLSVDNFINHLEELYQKKEEGFYGWNGLRYFLYEYELELQKKAKGEDKVSWSDLSKKAKEETIEHIYPQTADNDYWIENMKKVIGKSKPKNIRLLHNLGNLVLLSRSKNSELQNFDFDFKKKHKDKDDNEVGFFNGSYSEIEVASYPVWNADSILNRGIKMLQFMDNRWDIKFDEWEIKPIQILGLEFLSQLDN